MVIKMEHKTFADSQYQNEPNTIAVNNWCNKNIGRAIRLSNAAFGNRSSLSLYKSGRLQINDELYLKLTACMADIESLETLPLRPYVSTIRHKQYEQKGLMYRKAINTYKDDVTIKRFAAFCNSDFNIDTYKDEKYKDIIGLNFEAFKAETGRGVKNRIDVSIMIKYMTDWDYSNDITARKLFAIVYSIITERKYVAAQFAYFINKHTTVQKYVFDYVVKTISIVNQLIENDHYLVNKARTLTSLELKSLNFELIRADLKHTYGL